MSETSKIQYLIHQQIDKEKWNECIRQSHNGLIYAYSFYLDAMSKHWDALVLGDYQMVMPLTWNRKFGIKYLYQPFLTAQLGLFGKGITEYIRDNFFKAIPSSFRYIDISLNSENIMSSPSGFDIHRSNYTLNLNPSYEKIASGYNENTKRNVKKAMQAGCKMEKGFSIEKVVTLALAQMKGQGNESKENTARFLKLYQLLHEKKIATTYGILSSGSELLASSVFFFSHNRAYYILVGNNPAGRDTGASHALIDAFIKDNAGKNLTLDFEGSDIPTLAAFYRGFGSVHEPYPHIRINRLPFFLKWLKK
jgi:hypothetical protein